MMVTQPKPKLISGGDCGCGPGRTALDDAAQDTGDVDE